MRRFRSKRLNADRTRVSSGGDVPRDGVVLFGSHDGDDSRRSDHGMVKPNGKKLARLAHFTEGTLVLSGSCSLGGECVVRASDGTGRQRRPVRNEGRRQREPPVHADDDVGQRPGWGRLTGRAGDEVGRTRTRIRLAPPSARASRRGGLAFGALTLDDNQAPRAAGRGAPRTLADRPIRASRATARARSLVAQQGREGLAPRVRDRRTSRRRGREGGSPARASCVAPALVPPAMTACTA
jgi:hypothetical protein